MGYHLQQLRKNIKIIQQNTGKPRALRVEECQHQSQQENTKVPEAKHFTHSVKESKTRFHSSFPQDNLLQHLYSNCSRSTQQCYSSKWISSFPFLRNPARISKQSLPKRANAFLDEPLLQLTVCRSYQHYIYMPYKPPPGSKMII